MIKFADTGEKITYLDGGAPTVADAERVAQASGRVVEVDISQDVVSEIIERRSMAKVFSDAREKWNNPLKVLLLTLIFTVTTINAQMNVLGRATCYGNGVGNVNIYANSSWCNGVYEQRQGRTDRNGYFALSFPAQCIDLYVEPYSRYSVFIPQAWYYQFPAGSPSVVSNVNFSCQ